MSPLPDPETPTPSETSSDTPIPSPANDAVNKFNFLKKVKAARNNPFVKSRPSLNRESSTAELFSRENSSANFFENSRLNLFETAPKPEVTNSNGKVRKIFFFLLHKTLGLGKIHLLFSLWPL